MEIELSDHFDRMNKVVAELLKGNNPTQISTITGLKRSDVVELIDEWKTVVYNDTSSKERAKEAISGADQHYSMLIKEAWKTVDDADQSGQLNVKAGALKLIAEHIGSNGFITTNISGSGDEVFVISSDEVVSEISKIPTSQPREGLSEYVGILALSQSALSHLKKLRPKDCGSLDYESYISANLLSYYTFREFYLPDLVWTEIDTEMDFSKLRSWSLDKLEKVTLK